MKSFYSGKLITSLLKDRGRSRRWVSERIQARQQSRLNEILSGKIAPTISSQVSNLPVSLTSWSARAEVLPLVLLSLIEQSVRPSEVHLWLSPDDQGILKKNIRAFFEARGVLFHESGLVGSSCF